MSREDQADTAKPVPKIDLEADRFSAMGMYASALGITKPYALSFGQGTEVDMKPTTGPKYGRYYQPGSYMIYAHNGLTGNKREVYAWRQVVLRGDMNVHVEIKPVVGGKPGECQIIAQEDGVDAASRYSIDWGDTSLPEDERIESVWLAPGQAHHKVLANGEHTVKVFDEHSLREGHFPITIDDTVNDPADPIVSVAPDPSDTTRHTVIVTFTKVTEGKPVMIDWGEDVENFEQEIANPKKGMTVTHKYAGQPTYVGLAYYKDGSGERFAFRVKIPWPEDAA